MPECLQFLYQERQLCGCSLLFLQGFSQPLYGTALLDWSQSSHKCILDYFLSKFCVVRLTELVRNLDILDIV